MFVCGVNNMYKLFSQKSNLKELHKLRGHKDEIEGIACHPTKQEVLSLISWGNINRVWYHCNA